jgi:hypothetical protein
VEWLKVLAPEFKPQLQKRKKKSTIFILIHPFQIFLRMWGGGKKEKDERNKSN